MSIPATKTARQAQIRSILRDQVVRSQAELAGYLALADVQVTQATLSRDLVEVGAIRVRDEEGGLRYRVRADLAYGPVDFVNTMFNTRLSKLCSELLVTAEGSGNIVILVTPPGAASFLAQAIDQAELDSVMGTIAGDDTIMVVSRMPMGGPKLAQHFLSLSETTAA
jgi:transcriptional regulator of arginine metabolism